VQFRRRGTKTWKSLANVTANGHGFVVRSLRSARRGAYRLAWAGAGTSRSVSVRR
jgi:hypothetical protein